MVDYPELAHRHPIALGFLMRPKLNSGKLGGRQMREYWLYDKRALSRIAALIAEEFGANLSHDSENRFEWFEGESEREGLRFNISRAHTESRTVPTNPARISLTGSEYRDANMTTIGDRLARCLRAEVQFGDVSYLGGDDFRFDAHRTFLPDPASP